MEYFIFAKKHFKCLLPVPALTNYTHIQLISAGLNALGEAWCHADRAGWQHFLTFLAGAEMFKCHSEMLKQEGVNVFRLKIELCLVRRCFCRYKWSIKQEVHFNKRTANSCQNAVTQFKILRERTIQLRSSIWINNLYSEKENSGIFKSGPYICSACFSV